MNGKMRILRRYLIIWLIILAALIVISLIKNWDILESYIEELFYEHFYSFLMMVFEVGIIIALIRSLFS